MRVLDSVSMSVDLKTFSCFSTVWVSYFLSLIVIRCFLLYTPVTRGQRFHISTGSVVARCYYIPVIDGHEDRYKNTGKINTS